MAWVQLEGIRKDFGIKELLKDVTLNLGEGDRIGLIGTNGSGKSTLLRIIAGQESPDGGTLRIHPDARVVYVPQQPEMDPGRTVLEQVFADSGEKVQAIREYELLSEQLAERGDDPVLLAKLSDLSHRLDSLNAWELESRIKSVLTQLGIHDFERRVGDLSGGYRKRLALAAGLVAEPDVLLLDEPTNHLDALTTEWLQDCLKRFRGAILLITHDRYFLDQVTNRILEIDRGDCYGYAGNYAYYLEKKAEQEASAASSQQKFAGVLRRELEWLQRGPKARSTKQKARIQRIEEMRETEFKQAQGKVEISTASRRLGKKAILLENVTKGYGDRTLLDDFTYEFSPLDRVGVIGPNGVGKSTLMNLITGRLEPDAGQVEIGSTVVFGYFDQQSEQLEAALNSSQRVIDYLKDEAELVRTADGQTITASQMLERFLFPPAQQFSPVSKLSGGEKRRLYLLRILMQAPNILILDEPTNDLDVQTLAVLEEYLEDFGGCVIVVSHDRYFLDRTVDQIFAFEDGQLKRYPGNYSMYLEFHQRQQVPTPETPPSVAAATVTESPSRRANAAEKPRRLSYKEKRELEQLEQSIPEWEERKQQLEETLYRNPPSGFSEVQALSQELADLEQRIEQGTERWLELSELAG